MPFAYPASGFNNVNEYQASGLPWVTSSALPSGGPVRHTFPWATKSVKLLNSSAGVIFLGFTRNGTLPANSNYFAISGSVTQEFDVRVGEVYITGTAGATYSLYASLTTIPQKNIPQVSGSVFPTGSAVG